ncbi:hypothetical protein Tco_1540141 [Tanacetum coccineum]
MSFGVDAIPPDRRATSSRGALLYEVADTCPVREATRCLYEYSCKGQCDWECVRRELRDGVLVIRSCISMVGELEEYSSLYGESGSREEDVPRGALIRLARNETCATGYPHAERRWVRLVLILGHFGDIRYSIVITTLRQYTIGERDNSLSGKAISDTVYLPILLYCVFTGLSVEESLINAQRIAGVVLKYLDDRRFDLRLGGGGGLDIVYLIGRRSVKRSWERGRIQRPLAGSSDGAIVCAAVSGY